MFPARSPQDQRPGEAWKLDDAKARFSEAVGLAESGVPVHVSVRGRPAVVIMAAADYARMAPAASGSLASLFADGPFVRLDGFEAGLVRERSPVRDAPSFEP